MSGRTSSGSFGSGRTAGYAIGEDRTSPWLEAIAGIRQRSCPRLGSKPVPAPRTRSEVRASLSVGFSPPRPQQAPLSERQKRCAGHGVRGSWGQGTAPSARELGRRRPPLGGGRRLPEAAAAFAAGGCRQRAATCRRRLPAAAAAPASSGRRRRLRRRPPAPRAAAACFTEFASLKANGAWTVSSRVVSGLNPGRKTRRANANPFGIPCTTVYLVQNLNT